MNIKTKFKIGDLVWFKGYNENFCSEIFAINIKVNYNGNIEILYDLWNDAIKYEHQLFSTEEELLNKLK